MTLLREQPVSRPTLHPYPRALHPAAWWVWALGMAVAASRTTNAVLLLLLITAAGFVVSHRRSDAPWARSFRTLLVLGAFVVALRVAFQAVVGAYVPGHVVFTLPELPLPGWFSGVTFGGPVTLEGLLAALREGLRLAAMIACVGAAMSLASPHRMLASLPATLYEAGVAVVVAISFAPEAVASVGRVREAQRLRGRRVRGVRGVRNVAVAVFEGGLTRSVSLAASMDSRGYGRRGERSARATRLAGACLLAGLLGVLLGSYGLLGNTVPLVVTVTLLLAGLAVASVGFVVSGRTSVRTRYRPDPWRWPEWAVLASGLAVAVAFVAATLVWPVAMNPAATPLTWPVVAPVALFGFLCGLTPAWLAPPPPGSASAAPTVTGAPPGSETRPAPLEEVGG